MDAWVFFIPVGAVAAVIAVVLWWLARLQNRTDDHADRISRMEGRDK